MDRTSESRLEALEITHKKLDDRLKEFEEHEPKNFRWSHFRTLLQEAPGKKNPSEVYCFIDQLLSDYDPPGKYWDSCAVWRTCMAGPGIDCTCSVRIHQNCICLNCISARHHQESPSMLLCREYDQVSRDTDEGFEAG